MLVFALYLKRSFKSMKGFCLPQEVYGKWPVFSLGGVFMCLLHTSFSPLMGRLFDHFFCQCLTLRKINEYNHVARVLQPMTPVIPSKNIIVALCQLHPLLWDLVLLPIFYYQPKHNFALDKTLFAQALTTTLRLSSSGLFGMVYEHLLKCFIHKTHPRGFQNYSKLLMLLLVGISLSRQP